jgi:hypothetical protein
VHFRSLSGRCVSIPICRRWTPVEETHLCLSSRVTNAAKAIVVWRAAPVSCEGRKEAWTWSKEGAKVNKVENLLHVHSLS